MPAEPARDTLPLAERIALIERDLASLAEGVVQLAARRDPSRVRSWLTVDDPETAELILREIAQWLAIVWIRYPGHALPECWAHHPAVVEELLTTMDHYKGCFRKGGTHQALADWHARYRPGVVERIRQYAPSCELGQHAAGKPHDPAVAPVVPGLDDLTSVAEHWAATGTCPYPTSAPI